MSKPGEGGERLERGMQPRILALLGEELRHLGQRRVVRLAQFRRVQHEVQVRDLRPRAREALVGVVERLDERFPRGRAVLRAQALDRGAPFGDQLVDRRGDVRGTDVGEAGKVREIEEWIHVL
jgi:hypothetical protein